MKHAPTALIVIGVLVLISCVSDATVKGLHLSQLVALLLGVNSFILSRAILNKYHAGLNVGFIFIGLATLYFIVTSYPYTMVEEGGLILFGVLSLVAVLVAFYWCSMWSRKWQGYIKQQTEQVAAPDGE